MLGPHEDNAVAFSPDQRVYCASHCTASSGKSTSTEGSLGSSSTTTSSEASSSSLSSSSSSPSIPNCYGVQVHANRTIICLASGVPSSTNQGRYASRVACENFIEYMKN